jgi:16S rRNA A1518/A1519 N6-dimethyltransferase RsmA/KsgA/DIM1 with predicted DNA glycosylase/AP lyase activity
MVSFIHDKDKIARIRDMKLLSDVVNLFMRHRRKMIRVCTKFAHGWLSQTTNWPEIFHQCSIDATQRPEQLSADSYVAMANLFYDYLKQK